MRLLVITGAVCTLARARHGRAQPDRTEVVLTKLFLAINGSRLSATSEEGARLMLDMVAAKADLVTLAAWLNEHCKPTASPRYEDLGD
jgi:hypothetical protein